MEKGKKKPHGWKGDGSPPPPHTRVHADLSRTLRGVTAGCHARGDGYLPPPPHLRSSLTSMYFLGGGGRMSRVTAAPLRDVTPGRASL